MGPQLADAGHRTTIRRLIDETGKPFFVYAHHPASARHWMRSASWGCRALSARMGWRTGSRRCTGYSEAVASGRYEIAPSRRAGAFRASARNGTAQVLCEYEVKGVAARGRLPGPRGPAGPGSGRGGGGGPDARLSAGREGPGPQLSHKADAGGVALGVRDEQELRAALRTGHGGGRARSTGGGGTRRADGTRRGGDDGRAEDRAGPGGVRGDRRRGGADRTAGRRGHRACSRWPRPTWRRCSAAFAAGRPRGRERPAGAGYRGLLRVWSARFRRWAAAGRRISEVDLNPVIVHEGSQGVIIVDGLAVWADSKH